MKKTIPSELQVIITNSLDKVIQNDFHDVYKVLPTTQSNGRTAIREYENKAGIYIILEENLKTKKEEIVYVGHSSYDLYKTILRHFQKWTDTEQNRISYKKRIINKTHNYKISVGITPKRSAKLVERELILMYAPRDNKEKLVFYEQKSDVEILKQYEKFLSEQHEKRRAKIMHVLRNPDKYSTKTKNEAMKEWLTVFRKDAKPK